MGKFIFASKLSPSELKKEELDANPLLNLLKDTPNFKPFAMRLTQTGVEHTPCGGQRGRQYKLDSKSAPKSLPSLIMKPIHIVDEFDAHKGENGAFKTIGVTLGGRITVNEDGEFIDAIGALWGDDYPGEVRFIQADNDTLGASYEIVGSVEDGEDNISNITNYSFGGSAILFKEDAAISNTKILFASVSDEREVIINNENEWEQYDGVEGYDETLTLGIKLSASSEYDSLEDENFGLIRKLKNKNTGATRKVRRFLIDNKNNVMESLNEMLKAKDLTDSEKKSIRKTIFKKHPNIKTDKDVVDISAALIINSPAIWVDIVLGEGDKITETVTENDWNEKYKMLEDADFALVSAKMNVVNNRIVKIRRYPMDTFEHAKDSLYSLIHAELDPEVAIGVMSLIMEKYPIKVEVGENDEYGETFEVKTASNNIELENGSVGDEGIKIETKKKIVKIYKGGKCMEFCEKCVPVYEKALEDGVILHKDSIDQKNIVASKDGEIENLKAEIEKLQVTVEKQEADAKAREEEAQVVKANLDAARMWDEKYCELFDEDKKDEVISIQAKILLKTATPEDINSLVLCKKTVSSLTVAASDGVDNVSDKERQIKANMDIWVPQAKICDASNPVRH